MTTEQQVRFRWTGQPYSNIQCPKETHLSYPLAAKEWVEVENDVLKERIQRVILLMSFFVLL